MATIVYRELEPRTGWWGLMALLGVLLAAGGWAFLHMEHQGHWVTGMDNQVVWGMPHVFAVFLIVAASGALNVASIASVFGRVAYKPLAPLSAVLALALLAGGLAVLVLDLGRPDRLIVAATTYNFRSIFAWNIFLYTGFFAIVGVYLWWMLERRMQRWSGRAGLAAFVWRLVLTTGTGSIFGFLVARDAYASALLAPTFVVYSLAYGTAAFLLALLAACAAGSRPLGDALLGRLTRLLGTLIAASFYFTVVLHLTNLYIARSVPVERFLLLDGGVYPLLFWLGQMAIGYALPFALIHWAPPSRRRIVLASLAVIAGGMAQMYVTIVGAQAWPLEIFPGWEARSTFFDGEIHPYTPSTWETMLGLGGVALAVAIVTLAVRVLRLLPEDLSDPPTDPDTTGSAFAASAAAAATAGTSGSAAATPAAAAPAASPAPAATR